MCAEDPQLAEFLQLMQPRHKNALWADKVSAAPQQAAGSDAEEPSAEPSAKPAKKRAAKQAAAAEPAAEPEKATEPEKAGSKRKARPAAGPDPQPEPLPGRPLFKSCVRSALTGCCSGWRSLSCSCSGAELWRRAHGLSCIALTA